MNSQTGPRDRQAETHLTHTGTQKSRTRWRTDSIWLVAFYDIQPEGRSGRFMMLHVDMEVWLVYNKHSTNRRYHTMSTQDINPITYLL